MTDAADEPINKWWDDPQFLGDRVIPLAKRYLEEAKLTAEQAMDALSWEMGDGGGFVPALPRAIKEQQDQLDLRWQARLGLFDPCYSAEELKDLPQDWQDGYTPSSREEIERQARAVLSPKEVARLLRQAARYPRERRLEIGERFLISYMAQIQDQEQQFELDRKLRELGDKGWSGPLEELLIFSDGTRRPSPGEWLREHGVDSPDDLYKAGLAFAYLARGETERRVVEAEKRIESLERKLARRPGLRQGTAYLSSLLTTEKHVKDARRKASRRRDKMTEEESRSLEARKLFEYQPLGAYERLVVLGLAAYAREQGLLDTHSWSLATLPSATQPAARVYMDYPGTSELARILGYEAGADGKIPKAVRTTLERALRSLATETRWITEPVLVPVKTKKGVDLVKDIRVVQTVWIEVAATLITKHVTLALHPVAVSSMLASFVEVPNLALRYENARKALGKARILDEWAACDDYFRYLALVKAGDGRKSAKREAKRRGEPIPERMTTVGEATTTARVSDDTLRKTIGLLDIVRDRGETVAKRRLLDAIEFTKQMGTLISATAVQGKEGQVWELVFPHPDGTTADPVQGLLLGTGVE